MSAKMEHSVDFASIVRDIFERRMKDRALQQTVAVFPESERAALVARIDDLGRRLDALIEATQRVREPTSFDLLLSRLMALISEAFNADRSSLFLYDGETRELVGRVAQGVSVNEIRFPADVGIAGTVFQSGQPAVILNAYADHRFNSAVDAGTGYHTHSILCVPVKTRGGDIIGVTEVLNKRSGDFTPGDSALLQAFTTHTAAAIEAAQLGERARDSRLEEARVLEITKAVSSELNIDKLLRKIIGIATELLEAERSTLFLHDPVTNELWSRIAEGIAEREIRIPADSGLAGEAFTTRVAINIPDAYADARFNPEIDQKTGFRTRSILCVPVHNKFGLPIGVVQVLNRRAGPFRLRDQRRLEMLAAQSAIALDNARLFREVIDERNYSENVLRSLSDGVITLDNFGNVVKLNRAASQILKVDPKLVLGLAATRVLGDANAWLLERVDKVLREQDADMIVDAVLINAEGSSAPVNVNITPLADTEGHPLGCTLIVEDITEEKRVRSTMARYMTAQVAEQVLAQGESVLGGRSQDATILFSDIKNFTTIAEQLGPQATVSMLNEYFSEMIEIVFEHGGILDKYIGDAIMAVFGTPFASPRDADNAVMVAIRMQEELKSLNQRRRRLGRPEFEVRIGINSGAVVAGNIGSARRMDYTVIGDAVNIAARLESANAQLGTHILISDSTRAQLNGDYRLRTLDMIRVKGKSEPIAIFEVRGCGDDRLPANEAELLAKFERGFAAYRGRNWLAAVRQFDMALATEATDQPSALMRQRAMYYHQHEPADDWDGVWSLPDK